MLFFKNNSENTFCKGAKDFAASFSYAKNAKRESEKFNNVAFKSGTALAVSVLFFLIICPNIIMSAFLIIISHIIINIIIHRSELRQNTALSYIG